MDTGNPSYFNRYRYCSNDPVNCIDPTGQSDFFKKFFDFGADQAAAQANATMTEAATAQGFDRIDPTRANRMMNDTLAAGALGAAEGMANAAANIGDQLANEVPSSAMEGDKVGVGIGLATALIPARAPGKNQVVKSVTEKVIGGKFLQKTKVVPGRGGGQSRAEIVTVKNADGKLIRTHKDSFDRAGKFQHRKPLRGGPEGRKADDP